MIILYNLTGSSSHMFLIGFTAPAGHMQPTKASHHTLVISSIYGSTQNRMCRFGAPSTWNWPAVSSKTCSLQIVTWLRQNSLVFVWRSGILCRKYTKPNNMTLTTFILRITLHSTLLKLQAWVSSESPFLWPAVSTAEYRHSAPCTTSLDLKIKWPDTPRLTQWLHSRRSSAKRILRKSELRTHMVNCV